MVKHRFEKLFSPEEANELIPRLEAIVRRLQALAQRLREQIKKLVQENPAGGFDDMRIDEIVERRPELRGLAAEMAQLALQVEGYGCFLKDVDLGLVDFPSELDNKVVFLCWQFGEPLLTAWHSIEGGFSNRRPLSGARKLYLN